MGFLLSLAIFGLVNLLAAISPGPDFLVVTKNSLTYSRRIGIITALGVGCGIFVHATYTIIGIGLVISQSIVVFSLIKLLGALYLCYLGFKILFSKDEAVVINEATGEILVAKTDLQAFREGFITNALNPKAAVFFVSMFSQLVSPTLPLVVQSVYGFEAAAVVFTWFAVLAFALSYSKIKQILGKFQSRILKVMGVALILLGARLAFERQ